MRVDIIHSHGFVLAIRVLLAAFSRRLFCLLPLLFALVAKPVTLRDRLQRRIAAECMARKITAFAEQHLLVIFFVVIFAHLRGDTLAMRHEWAADPAQEKHARTCIGRRAV